MFMQRTYPAHAMPRPYRGRHRRPTAMAARLTIASWLTRAAMALTGIYPIQLAVA